MDIQIYGWIFRYMDRQKDGQIERWIDGQQDRWVARQMGSKIDGQQDRWAARQIEDSKIDRQTDNVRQITKQKDR